jgi:hypothetical protein
MVVKQFGWGVGVESLPLIGYVMSVSMLLASVADLRFVCRLQPSDTQTSNCLGVIWSSLTGN